MEEQKTQNSVYKGGPGWRGSKCFRHRGLRGAAIPGSHLHFFQAKQIQLPQSSKVRWVQIEDLRLYEPFQLQQQRFPEARGRGRICGSALPSNGKGELEASAVVQQWAGTVKNKEEMACRDGPLL